VFIVLAVVMERLLPADFRPAGLEEQGEGADV